MRIWAKSALTVVLLALTLLSWTHYLDDAANEATLTHFKRALAVAAMARGFNGIISVAQGTEVAVQPVGVGVTLTIGEVLDPLNDLVERFSALALLASVSLGLQISLGQMAATPWLSGALSIAVLAYLVLLWRSQGGASERTTQVVTRIVGGLIFLRFLLAVTLLATHFIDQSFLADRHDEAVANLTAVSATIENLQEQGEVADPVTETEEDFFDRTAAQISGFLDASAATLDLETQLNDVKNQVEQSVEEMINLIVIFLLQTILLPVASLWLSWWALRAFLRGSPSQAD
jgi:hypothetical protein